MMSFKTGLSTRSRKFANHSAFISVVKVTEHSSRKGSLYREAPRNLVRLSFRFSFENTFFFNCTNEATYDAEAF